MLRKFGLRISSLRIQISSFVLLAWLAPTLALGGSIVSVYFPALREKTQAALAAGALGAHQTVVGDIDRLIKLAKDVTYDGEITSAYSWYRSGDFRYQDFYRLCKNYLERRFSRNALIGYAAFFSIDEPEQFIFTSAGYPAAFFFQQGTQPRLLEMSEKLDTLCRFIYRDGQIYLVRNLLNGRLERYGMLVLSIKQDVLLRPLEVRAREWGARLDVGLGEYHSDEAVDWARIPPGLSESEGDLLYRADSLTRDYDFRMAVRQPKATLFAGIENIRRVFGLLLLALVPVCVLVMIYLHKRVIRPINILSEAAGRIEAGELGVTVPMQGADEMGRLGSAFSGMSVKIARLVDTVYKEEIALRDAQIQAMQSRINPHFLNNALELINWQARMDGEGGVCAMVDALSVLMNAAMDRGHRRLVPLKEELDIADAYLYFIEQRFGEKLTVGKRVDERLLDREIPRLIIQPLLENAVEHGIAPASGGHIRLNVFGEGESLAIELRNSGKPLSAADLERVRAILESGRPEGNHLGLSNVRERLRLIYRDQALISLTQDGDDTLARVLLPPGVPKA